MQALLCTIISKYNKHIKYNKALTCPYSSLSASTTEANMTFGGSSTLIMFSIIKYMYTSVQAPSIVAPIHAPRPIDLKPQTRGVPGE